MNTSGRRDCTSSSLYETVPKNAYKVLVRYNECFVDEIITEFAQVRQVSLINLKDKHFDFLSPPC